MELEQITCPCCLAKPILVDGGAADIDPCKHLAFVYHTQAANFEFAAALFLARLPSESLLSWNIECYKEILATANLLPQLLIIEVLLEPYGHFNASPSLIIGFYRHEQTTS